MSTVRRPDVLVIAADEDGAAPPLVRALERRGLAVAVVDQTAFPTAVAVAFTVDAGATSALLETAHGRISLDDVKVGVLRSGGPSRPDPRITDPLLARYVRYEASQFVEALWHGLGCAWFPAAPHAVDAAQSKIAQLRLAARLGLRLPSTLVTNDPAAALAFVRAQRLDVLAKLPNGVVFPDFHQEYARYAAPITRRDLVHLDGLRLCPATLQTYVAKRRELRVLVVGDEVFAVAIESQDSHRTRHDWRRYDHVATSYAVVALPDDVARRCVALVRALGLHYGAIDLIETPEGEHVFLEINAAGQYQWLEERTGLPLTDAIAGVIARLATSAPHPGAP